VRPPIKPLEIKGKSSSVPQARVTWKSPQVTVTGAHEPRLDSRGLPDIIGRRCGTALSCGGSEAGSIEDNPMTTMTTERTQNEQLLDWLDKPRAFHVQNAKNFIAGTLQRQKDCLDLEWMDVTMMLMSLDVISDEIITWCEKEKS
jgi:hypothetical protein